MNGDYNSKLTDCDIELTKIKTWIDANKLHSNVRFLVNYAIIKSCGTIEQVYKHIIFDKLTENANEYNINYLNKILLSSSSNPSFGQIKRTLENINGSWASDFDTRLYAKNEKGELNSLVDLRNTFSHGGTITSSIEDVIRFYQGSKWVLEQMNECINT